MKTALGIIFLAILICTAPQSTAFAYSITFDSMNITASGYAGTTKTTKEAWATVWDFNTGLDGVRPNLFDSYTAHTAAVVSGSLSGLYAAPESSDDTPYLSVPGPDGTSSGSITVKLKSGTNNYFGLYWGSIDTYNSITFFKGITQLLSFTGETVAQNYANGNQTAPPSNTYVNFYGLDAFDSFKLASTSRAFEVDNVAVGTAPVPEPATMLLFGTGLVGLAGFRRKKQ